MTEGVQEHRRPVGEMMHKHAHTHTHRLKHNLNIHTNEACFSDLSLNCLWSDRKQRQMNECVCVCVCVCHGFCQHVCVLDSSLKVLIGGMCACKCVSACFSPFPAAFIIHLLPPLSRSLSVSQTEVSDSPRLTKYIFGLFMFFYVGFLIH